MEDCVFCKIVESKLPAKIVHESDNILAFLDINPLADIHILIIPKIHISEVRDLTSEHGSLLVEIYQAANKLVEENNLKDNFYRILVSGGKAQDVPHLHFHLLGGQWNKQI